MLLYAEVSDLRYHGAIQASYRFGGEKGDQSSSEYTGLFMEAVLEHKEEIFEYIQSYYRKFMKGAKAEEFPFFCLMGE